MSQPRHIFIELTNRDIVQMIDKHNHCAISFRRPC